LAKTISFFDQDNRAATPRAPTPYLVIAINGQKPLAPATRLCLSDVHQVDIGRGDQRRCERKDGVLHIELPDGWMSSDHAQITHLGRRWQLRDAGSKNGTFVQGLRLNTPHDLADGDMIAVGNMMLVFRLSQAPVGDRELTADLTAWSTLNGRLEKDLESLAKICRTAVTVLITGETGTGKDLLARTIHERSQRPGEFVPLNCGAIAEHLIESELFGHKRGAFSGADVEKKGWIRQADRGTLFLDEIAELPAHLQEA